MSNGKRSQDHGVRPRTLSGIAIGVALLIGAIFVVFLIFFALREPERVANPADVGAPEVPEEGVAVPDGGELTSEPNQAAPDSPARAMDPDQQ